MRFSIAFRKIMTIVKIFHVNIEDFTQFVLIKSAEINILGAKYLFTVQGFLQKCTEPLHLNNSEMLVSRYAAAFHNCSAVII